jgi:creatinine amidohydrolase
MLIWRGCGGHDLRSIVGRFNATYQGIARAYLPGHPFHDIWCSVADSAVPGGHADSFTTSIALYRHPEAVRLDRLPQSVSEEPAWDDPELDFARYSTTGVIGDANHASAALGERLWSASVDAVAAALRSIGTHPNDVVIEPTM